MPAGSTRRLVALSLPPGDAFIAAAEQVWSADGAILPLDPKAPGDVVRRLLGSLRPDAVVDADGEHVFGRADPLDEEVAVVIATSGSTGEPKGAQLTWAALDASAAATHDRIALDAGDRWLSCLPWQHIGGLQVWLRARMSGRPLEVHPTFDPAAVAGADATLVSLVPTQLARLLDAGVDLRRFRVVLLGGAAASTHLLDRARAAGAPVVTTYGMSETSGGCVYDGQPLDGVEVSTAADGRIRLRGPVLMTGYRGRQDLTAAAFDDDGWFVTSDLGSVDGQRLTVHGRADDLVITGGENVSTGAVADLLVAHPGIADVAVTAVADEEWGQRVVAVVVVAGAPPTLDELRHWVLERALAAWAPRGLVVVDAIPRLTSGKPDRLAVQAIAQEASVGGAG